ncbi:putative prophage protein [Escherichia coli]|nr:putative prophage protein [Escherichia coli]
MVDADGEAVRVEIVNGVKGVRSLIDSYTLAAMKVFLPAVGNRGDRAS